MKQIDHEPNCATNASDVADEFKAMGCTCKLMNNKCLHPSHTIECNVCGTEFEIESLIKIIRKLYSALVKYEWDVDEEPTSKHVKMMEEAERIMDQYG